MNEKDFLELYRKEKDLYFHWGNYVKDYIVNKVKAFSDLNSFFKVPPSCRTKEENSLIEKAFYRNKSYKNPYHDIQDKVGIRFVVLYLDEIQIIENIIESCTIWDFSKDKNFLEEREKNPEMFGYESIHYIVKNKDTINIDKNIVIPKNTPCEIQIRTLMQHAYSEMSHSILYKKRVQNELKRFTSRSMALIESADYFFEEVKKKVANTDKISLDLYNSLINYYYSFAPNNTPEEKINNIIIDSLHDLLYENMFIDIKKFIENESYLKEIINRNYNLKLMYRQPTILLVYYLIDKHKNKFYKHWPLPDDELCVLYNDLGISLNID